MLAERNLMISLFRQNRWLLKTDITQNMFVGKRQIDNRTDKFVLFLYLIDKQFVDQFWRQNVTFKEQLLNLFTMSFIVLIGFEVNSVKLLRVF